MKTFKIIATRTAPRYEITPDKFIKVTKNKHPFEQRNAQGEFLQYGICPSCLNPIRLIGISREIKTKPYGKHAGKSIDGLPQWNYRKYEYCPFAAKNDRRNPCDEERLPEFDDQAAELYNLLKEQFDRVVYVIKNELNIQCSTAFWTSAFKQYIADGFYLYPWLTESNLPYIFAYRGLHHQKIYRQSFLKDSDIYTSLVNYPGVAFEKTSGSNYEQLVNKDGCFLELYFRFYGHKHKVSEGETLRESMIFCIDDRRTNKTVYECVIEFDEMFFMNLINKANNENKRQIRFLEIADKMPTAEELRDKLNQRADTV
jgi:hypothetical protein